MTDKPYNEAVEDFTQWLLEIVTESRSMFEVPRNYGSIYDLPIISIDSGREEYNEQVGDIEIRTSPSVPVDTVYMQQHETGAAYARMEREETLSRHVYLENEELNEEGQTMTEHFRELEALIKNNKNLILRILGEELSNAVVPERVADIHLDFSAASRSFVVSYSIDADKIIEKGLIPLLQNFKGHDLNHRQALANLYRLITTIPIDYSSLRPAQKDELRKLLPAVKSILEQDIRQEPVNGELPLEDISHASLTSKRRIKVRRAKKNDLENP